MHKLSTGLRIHAPKRRAQNLPFAKIIRLEGAGNYTWVHSTEGSYLISRTLRFYEQQLGLGFYRIHKRHLISLQHILFVGVDGVPAKTTITMDDDTFLPVAKSRQKAFLQNYQRCEQLSEKKND